MGYITKPVSRKELRQYSLIFRDLFNVPKNGPFPVLESLEKLPDTFEGSTYMVVENDELPKNVVAQCVKKEEKGFTIEIKQYVYDGALARIGAYWQSKGMTVIPTLSWSQPSSFKFCFDGIEKHSVVAVGMIGCKQERVSFMKGYKWMQKVIEPSAIICFGKPFPEMLGNIITVDYISSRRVVRNGR